jgi:hypothetical protein
MWGYHGANCLNLHSLLPCFIIINYIIIIIIFIIIIIIIFYFFYFFLFFFYFFIFLFFTSIYTTHPWSRVYSLLCCATSLMGIYDNIAGLREPCSAPVTLMFSMICFRLCNISHVYIYDNIAGLREPCSAPVTLMFSMIIMMVYGSPAPRQ